MAMMHRMDIALLDRMKIYAEIMKPVMDELREELGAERAEAIIRKALMPWRRELGLQVLELAQGEARTAAKLSYDYSKAEDSFEDDVHADDDARFHFDVTSCGYAAFFRELGDTALGFLLACSGDFDMYDALDDVDFQRSQTIMQGATHCDFRLRFSRHG